MQKRKWTYEERKQWLKEHNKLFYCNKEDTAIFIRKQYALAWTLNWGNPWSYIIMGTIIVLIVIVCF
ncbi:hypothetical protein PBV87_02865 [Niameybacter massiliensis]|uniref:Uncharacterized protein n=1 Tax=Holtiella tumoricola TaxID=3018743 RepID=A0AA42DK03_9FIRM|nr:hypothetical protein [Holtiella tumoricola]MDA3730447.1 hypothetical protein [Holtiella tumoricola]